MDGITIKKVDARRLLCPLPVIRAQDAISGLKSNDQLIITCTDPGAKHDIPSWCRINGHQIEDISEAGADIGKEIIITIRVGNL
jgi:tRNA 2-thiouridine synthesizing protein A